MLTFCRVESFFVVHGRARGKVLTQEIGSDVQHVNMDVLEVISAPRPKVHLGATRKRTTTRKHHPQRFLALALA